MNQPPRGLASRRPTRRPRPRPRSHPPRPARRRCVDRPLTRDICAGRDGRVAGSVSVPPQLALVYLVKAVSTSPVPTVWSRGRLMAALFAAQVSGSAGQSIGMAVGGIMAAEITGTNAWSGLPVAVGALGTALASWPLARLMARVGRRPGLALGYGLAVVGAGLGMAGVLARSFPLLLVGMILFGIAQTSNLLARYAAAD